MAKKAKKKMSAAAKTEKILPMPKLGWKDHLVYCTAITLTAGFSLLSHFVFDVIRGNIAFSDPKVIARIGGSGNLWYFGMAIWCILAFTVIMAGFYSRRIPIFGRKDIQYGAPKYQSVYPLFMKNKPELWISPKEKQAQKRDRTITAVVIISTFLICAAAVPFSFHGRAVLNEDGSVAVYDALNRKVQHYEVDEITAIELTTDKWSSRRSFVKRWYAELVIHTADSENYDFSMSSFRGNDLRNLQTMLYMKEEIFGNECVISGTDKLPDVIKAKDLNDEEITLLYRLFEIANA